ncbi:MAG: dihydrofolate reductase family protein, partial [Frankiaceae bacterium]|nr:dihydrofolate reductase family protein [Frankiaceae bacterium]
DGYVADESGNFEWAAPNMEVHQYVNDQARSIGTYLYGRQMYETLRVWETWDTSEEPAAIGDYAAIWRAAEKVVFSSTLTPADIDTDRTRLESSFDPDMIRSMKDSVAEDVSIGGPTLAAHALRAGLVDHLHLFLNPIVVGGGTPALPANLRLDVELADEHRFGNGVIHLHYAVRS